jgi:hypothetical protein
MLRTKTLFVIGAGASAEFGLPIGSELSEYIKLALNFESNYPKQGTKSGSQFLWYAFEKTCTKNQVNVQEYFAASKRICRSIPDAKSIDTYLSNDINNEILKTCAKTAIVEIILNKENSINLYCDTNEDIKNIRPKTYLHEIFQILNDGITDNTLDTIFDNMEIICFNYDRCIEYFFYKKLISYYGINSERSLSLVKNLKIVRPYGSIGDMIEIKFGETINSDSIIQISNNIKFFSETNTNSYTEESNQTSEKLMVILGFGFHRQNMNFLRDNLLIKGVNKILATCYLESESNSDEFRKSISSFLPEFKRGNRDYVTIKNMKCAEFIRDHSKVISD